MANKLLNELREDLKKFQKGGKVTNDQAKALIANTKQPTVHYNGSVRNAATNPTSAEAYEKYGIGRTEVDAFSETLSAPARAVTWALSGKYQDPSAAMGIKNPYLAAGVDLVLDPANALFMAKLGKLNSLNKLSVQARVPKYFKNTSINLTNPKPAKRIMDKINKLKTGLVADKAADIKNEFYQIK